MNSNEHIKDYVIILMKNRTDFVTFIYWFLFLFQDIPGSEPASLSEFLLTAADLVSLRMRARLVVLSSCHTREQHGWASADGVAGLTRALLASGVQCVLLALWPVPDTAAKILLRAFYSALLQVCSKKKSK